MEAIASGVSLRLGLVQKNGENANYRPINSYDSEMIKHNAFRMEEYEIVDGFLSGNLVELERGATISAIARRYRPQHSKKPYRLHGKSITATTATTISAKTISATKYTASLFSVIVSILLCFV